MQVIPIPCLFDNYAYIVACTKTRDCMVVDPAEYYPVISTVSLHGFNLVGILCTHHHRDHIDGIDDMLADDPGLEVYGHKSDGGRITGLNRPVEDGSWIRIGELNGNVFHTPGHTKGSVSYYFSGALFTGDTLFGGGCGRLFEGTPEQMYNSLKRIVETFPPETKVYPGHEYTRANLEFARDLEPDNQALQERINNLAAVLEAGEVASDLALERATNPFLRCGDEGTAIRQKLLAERLQVGDDPVALFSAVRRIKDGR